MSSDHRSNAAANRTINDDAEDFERFSEGVDSIDLEAGLWAARQRGGLDKAAQTELDAWLAADTRHRAAYDAMVGVTEDVSQVPQEQINTWRRKLPSPSSRFAQWRQRWRQQYWVPGCAVAVLLLSFLVLLAESSTTPEYSATLATGAGELQSIVLPDGSQLDVDTDTALQVRMYAQRREIQLQRGQILLDVQHDAQRPFQVKAGAARMTVLGTRFSVRHTSTGLDANETRLTVARGRVRIEPASSGLLGLWHRIRGTAHELTAGQTIAMNASGTMDSMASVPEQSVGVWRDGRIQFNATPLQTALEEFSRYGQTRIVLQDSSLASLPVGGTFSQRQIDGFLQSLEMQLPVRIIRRGDSISIARRP